MTDVKTMKNHHLDNVTASTLDGVAILKRVIGRADGKVLNLGIECTGLLAEWCRPAAQLIEGIGQVALGLAGILDWYGDRVEAMTTIAATAREQLSAKHDADGEASIGEADKALTSVFRALGLMAEVPVEPDTATGGSTDTFEPPLT